MTSKPLNPTKLFSSLHAARPGFLSALETNPAIYFSLLRLLEQINS
jgi:hypothetical protein